MGLSKLGATLSHVHAAQAAHYVEAGAWTPANSTVVVALIGACAILLAALIAAGVALYQVRSGRKTEWQKLERSHWLDIDREKQAEDRKMETELAAAAQKAEAEQAAAAEAAAAEAVAVAVEARNRLKQEAAEADAREQRAIDYRMKIIGRLGNLKILDMSRSLDLDKLYVQLRVRHEEAPRYVSDDDIAELAAGEPERMLRLSREHARTRTAGSLPPQDALSRFTRMVVLGDPGAGKTTMLRYLAFRAAWKELGAISLPVYVELRDFIDSGDPDLLSYAAGDMDRRYRFPDARSYLEERFDDGGAILLLDGLDEVLGGETADAATAAYQRVASEAARLATRYPKLPIAVTCRKAGWRGGLSQFQTLEVLDFDWPEIETFINNWFTDIPAKATGLCDALRKNLRMQTLAANPLLLSLIAIVYERELELPERRAELYNRCVEVLLKDWDAHRDIKRFSQFTTDRKRDLLEEIAWHYHKAGRRYFPRDELIGIIGAFLPTIDIGPENAAAILAEIVAQYGLLKEQAHDWYGFLHLTIQEYFAAYAANERCPEAVALVARSRHDPWWEEVILLLAGRMSDASPLILGILGRAPDASEPPDGEPLAADDDLFHGDLLLVGRCLASRPRLRASWLRERIVNELWELLRTSPYGHLMRSAARVLAESGSPANRAKLLEHVADEGVRPESRCAAVYALNIVELAPRLLAVLEGATPPVWRVSVAIIDVLAALRYKESVPTLLRMLWAIAPALPQVQGSPIELRLRRRCCHALGELGDASVKEELWRMVDQMIQSHDDSSLLSDLIESIGGFGDQSDVDRLFALSNRFVFGALDAAANISGSAIAPRLLDVLVDENSESDRMIDALRAMRRIKMAGINDKILRVIVDPRIDDRVGEEAVWLLTDDNGHCRSELLRLLDDPAAGARIKFQIAAVLAGWGIPSGVPHLLAVFEGERLSSPDSLTAQASARALGNLGNYRVLPHIIERYASNGYISYPWHVALEEFPITKETLPVLYEALDSGTVNSLDPVLAGKIGEVADTPDDARHLLRMFLAMPESKRGEAFTLFFALREVSERARMRVFADGRIVPMVG